LIPLINKFNLIGKLKSDPTRGANQINHAPMEKAIIIKKEKMKENSQPRDR
jgi:hypothetical protein